MKRIICAILACVVCSSVAVGLSGCGCSNKTQEPGYKIEETQPDLKDGDFGFFIVNKDELMITKYTGSDKELKLPASYNNYKVTTIGSGVFNNSDITSVEMPDSITTIKDYAFYSCDNLTEVKFSKNLKTLGTNVFNMCRKLEKVDIPASVKDLGVYTFSATALKSVTIPESKNLTKLSHYVFYQCQDLKEVTIPATIKSMEDNTIADCPNKITINAPKGSCAEKYAKEHKLGFKEIK